jgi:hypothetical protein
MGANPMATAPASSDGRANLAAGNPAEGPASGRALEAASEIGSDLLPRKLRKVGIRR